MGWRLWGRGAGVVTGRGEPRQAGCPADDALPPPPPPPKRCKWSALRWQATVRHGIRCVTIAEGGGTPCEWGTGV